MAAQKPTAKVKTAESGDTNPTEQRGEDEEIIMAEDARISAALSAHPKTRKLRKRLGVPGCWSLVCLFLWDIRTTMKPYGDVVTDEMARAASKVAGLAVNGR